MTLDQQWNTVVEAFTLSSLSLEQKEELYQEQYKIDSSDTSKLVRARCDSLKANTE